MTERQFLAKLEALLEKCTCGTFSSKAAGHDSKCKCRLLVWMLGKQNPDYRAITGGLYDTVTDPEAVAA